MNCSITEYDPIEFISTSKGDLISRTAIISRPQALDLPSGKCIIRSDVLIRADLAPVRIEKYTILHEKCILRPPYCLISDKFRFIPISIGPYSSIGCNSVIESAVIGLGCQIGENCVLGKRFENENFFHPYHF